MKKLFFLLIAFISVLVSCGKKVDLSLQYEVIKSEAAPEDLWLFTMSNHLLGIDPITFEEKLDIKFNYYVSSPHYINDKIYLAEQTNVHSNLGSSIWGYNVICLNKDLTLNCEIPVHPNTWNISKNGDFLVTDTYCYGFDDDTGKPFSGFTIIDLKTNKCIYKNETLSEIICNAGEKWSYKNRLFLGTYSLISFKQPFAVSIYNLDTQKFEALNSRIFSSHSDEENLKWEYAFININDNQLWITYYFYHTICVYDLDTYDPVNQTCERIAKIDLKKDYNIPELANEPEPDDIEYNFENSLKIGGTGGQYRMTSGQFINGKYHVVLRKKHNEETQGLNAIFVIDPDTFELEKQIKIDDFFAGVDEMKYSLIDEGVLVIRRYENSIESYDVNTGELLYEKIVFQQYE